MFELTQPSLAEVRLPVRAVQRSRPRSARPTGVAQLVGGAFSGLERRLPAVPDARPRTRGRRATRGRIGTYVNPDGLAGLVDSLGLGQRGGRAAREGHHRAGVQERRAGLRGRRARGAAGGRRAGDRPAAPDERSGRRPVPFGTAILALQLIAALTFLGYTATKKDVQRAAASPSAPFEFDVVLPDAEGPPAGQGAGGRSGRARRRGGSRRSGSRRGVRGSRCGSTPSSRARSSRTPRRPSAPRARFRR